MDPRHWNPRSVSIFINQVNKSLEDMMITMDRVQTIVQEVQKMKPAWHQLRNSVREPERKVNTKKHTKPRTKRRESRYKSK
jgi:uncharacterized protein YoxC